MRTEYKSEEIMVIDLHGFTVKEGKKYLTQEVISAPPIIREIVVIHGYHNGTALMNMVRNDFKCRRVSRKCLSMNQGITSLIIK